jgi:hypothetical protein
MPANKQSAFKQLYLDVFRSGDFSKLHESIPKKKLTCYVKEAHPHFLIADDFFFVPCYFTQKAIDDFRSKNSNVKVTDLQLRVIELSNWTLEIVKVNSADVFTSYGGLELRIVVKEFNINSKQGAGAKVKPEDLARYPLNIYRDDEVKSAIQAYTHSCVASAVKSGVKGDSLPDASKTASISNGIVKFANGDKFNSWNFKESKTSTVNWDAVVRSERGGSKGKGSVSVKPRVSGGKGKAAAKAGSSIGSKLAKFTPARDSGKKSKVQKTGTTPKTPGNKASVASVGKISKSTFAKFQKKYLKK